MNKDGREKVGKQFAVLWKNRKSGLNIIIVAESTVELRQTKEIVMQVI